MSSTLVSDLETDIPDEDGEDGEDEDEDEGYEMVRPLRGIEHTPGSSMDNLDSSVTGERRFFPALHNLPCLHSPHVTMEGNSPCFISPESVSGLMYPLFLSTEISTDLL